MRAVMPGADGKPGVAAVFPPGPEDKASVLPGDNAVVGGRILQLVCVMCAMFLAPKMKFPACFRNGSSDRLLRVV
jgi:hypothetical protein